MWALSVVVRPPLRTTATLARGRKRKQRSGRRGKHFATNTRVRARAPAGLKSDQVGKPLGFQIGGKAGAFLPALKGAAGRIWDVLRLLRRDGLPAAEHMVNAHYRALDNTSFA